MGRRCVDFDFLETETPTFEMSNKEIIILLNQLFRV